MPTNLYVKIEGKGEPLVLLHGWGWHSGIWQPLVPLLSNHYTLYLLDLPGFGKSPLTFQDYSLDNIAAQIFEVVPAQATWLGWSMGGLIAWWVALRHPEKMSRLITLCSSPCFLQKTNWPGLTTAIIEKFSDSLTKNYEQTLLDFLILQLRGNREDIAESFETLKQQIFSVKKPPLEALIGGLQLLEKTDLRAELGKVSCPNLHIFGRLDKIVPAAVIPRIKALLPSADCEVIPDSGHIPFLSEPELFIKLIG
jgi:pimeloyl-[acyl-carrier protein] methyl ester esterase